MIQEGGEEGRNTIRESTKSVSSLVLSVYRRDPQ